MLVPERLLECIAATCSFVSAEKSDLFVQGPQAPFYGMNDIRTDLYSFEHIVLKERWPRE